MSRTGLQHGIMDSVPESVYAAFESEPHLTMPKLAKVLRMDLKTIGKHREAGNLPVHIKGTGLERRHYVCTLGDVIADCATKPNSAWLDGLSAAARALLDQFEIRRKK